MKKIFLIMTLFVFLTPQVQAGDFKKFLSTCTYGVIAGGLIGAASLAFSEDPGTNLNPIARGASLGLYGGIIVGWIQMDDPQNEDSSVLIVPQRDGLQAQWTVFQF